MKTLALKNVRVITDRKTLDKATVLIQGDRILDVTRSESPFPGADVLDLSGKTVLPGLVNAHIHFINRRVFGLLQTNVGLDIAALAFRAVRTALCCLRDGVTSTRDMGHAHLVQWDLRDAIEKGVVPGPRIRCSRGAIVMSYGHGYHRNHNVHSLDESLKEIRKQANESSDFIKVLVSHDDLPFVSNPESCVPWFPATDLKEMASLAQSTGMRITGHANGKESIERVIDAGFDCLEHGIFMTRDLAKRMAEKGMFYCPTMTGYKQNSDPSWERGDFWHTRYAKLWTAHKESVQNAILENVRIVAGTDTLGDLIEELELLKECGMDSMSAIQSASTVAGELLKINDVGSIASGKLADLVIVDGNPLESLSNLRRVQMVVKSGKLYNPAELRNIIPVSPLFRDDPNPIKQL